MNDIDIEIGIKVNFVNDDRFEGTWHGSDDRGYTQEITHGILAQIADQNGWPKAEASLYDESGREACDDITHGEFVCYKDGVPR